MTRSTWTALLFLAAPAAVLAVFALRAAEHDAAAARRACAERIDAECAALARRIEAALADAAAAIARARDAPPDAPRPVVASCTRGELLGFAHPELHEPAPGGDEELRLYGLGLAGGEAYELGDGDPALAIDAYAFYLPRLRTPHLRERMRFRIARAALAAGRPELAVPILRGILETSGPARSEEGWPLALLAAELLERAGAPADEAHERIREWLHAHHAELATPVFESFRARYAPEDSGLRDVLAARRRLERALARFPELAREPGARIHDGFLVHSAPAERETVAPGRLAVLAAPVHLPELAAGDLEAALFDPASGSEPSAHATGSRRIRPVVLGKGSGPVTIVAVEDPASTEKLAAIDVRLASQRALVALLGLTTLAGGAVLLLAVRRERELARTRERLLANVSHELKTPITSIRMFGELLAEDPEDRRQVERFAGLLHAESLRLGRIVENVLDFAGRRRRSRTQLEPTDLGEVLVRVAEVFECHARDRDIAFETEGIARDGKAGAGPVILSSGAALERILFNLLDNAIKYRRDGAPRVLLRSVMRPHRIFVSVTDNGSGIARADQERIFEEFYRARFEDYGVQGSGLGLAIARRLARELGGDITVESAPGRGSTFTLVLPRREVPQAAPPAPERPAAPLHTGDES